MEIFSNLFVGVERRELILYNNASKEIPKNLDYSLFVADQVVFGLKKSTNKTSWRAPWQRHRQTPKQILLAISETLQSGVSSLVGRLWVYKSQVTNPCEPKGQILQPTFMVVLQQK